MKKIIIFIYVLFISCGLLAAGPDTNKYEEYIVINYLMNEKEFEKAGVLIDNFLKKYPDDPFILTEKAYLLKDIKNDHKRAVALIKQAKEIYPGYYYANYLHARLLFARYYENEKDKGLVDKAVEYLKASIEDNKDFYSSYFLLAAILSEIGEYNESNKYFELSNRLKETPEAYFNMSSNYRKLADVAGEINSYKKLLEFNPDNLNILRILSRLYLEKRDYKNAAIFLEKLYLLDPEDNSIASKYLYSLFAAGENDKFLAASKEIDISGSTLLTYARAFILSTKERFAEAEKLLNQLKEKDLKSKILLADIYYRKQDYYKGYQILKKIDKKDKNYIYYSLLFEILSGLNMNRKIAEVFNRIKTNNSILGQFTLNDYYTIVFAYSYLNETQNMRQTALKFFNKQNKSAVELKELIHLLELFPGINEIELENVQFEPNIFLIIGLYKNLKKFEKAISLINHMLKKRDEQAYYIELCDIYLLQEKNKEVENLLKRLIVKYPASILVRNYYAYFLAMQNKELESALKLSAHTLEEDGENPAYLDTYGYILFKLGRTSESIKYLQKAYDKHPLEQEIIEHVADYYRQTKNFKKVIEIYEKAIKNGVDFKEQLLEKIKKIKIK